MLLTLAARYKCASDAVAIFLHWHCHVRCAVTWVCVSRSITRPCRLQSSVRVQFSSPTKHSGTLWRNGHRHRFQPYCYFKESVIYSSYKVLYGLWCRSLFLAAVTLPAPFVPNGLHTAIETSYLPVVQQDSRDISNFLYGH